MADPVWLPDVLREAGLVCTIYPGAFDRGHGDFGDIWGVVCHHTGSFGETARGIAEHPELGLASQLYLSPDGEYTLCGVGVAWHAGSGSWPGLPTDGANQYTIGIEAANDGGGAPGKPHRTGWSDAQYNAYVKGVAAILRKLGQPASHAIGHKEWAGAAQGKWDPGAIDMSIFRADVAREMNQATGGISMADAKSLTDKFDGNDAAGKPLSYRQVNLLREGVPGDLKTAPQGIPGGPNVTPSVFDHITTLAKILTRRYKGKDAWDMLVEIYQVLVEKK